jgi:hypothetical protein
LKAENRKRRAGERDGRVEGRNRSEVELLGDKRYVAWIFPLFLSHAWISFWLLIGTRIY